MKQDYMSRLSRWARWYLPEKEAAEVLEDYREIVEGRSEEELQRDVGGPRETIRRLAQTRAYRQWLAVFAVLAFCVLIPAVTPMVQAVSLNAYRRLYFLWDFGRNVVFFTWLYFVAGMVLSLVWCRCIDRRKPGGPVPKAEWLILALLLVGMAFQWFMAWILIFEPVQVIRTLFSTRGIVKAIQLLIDLDVLMMGVTGLFGLIQYRMSGRRWSAVYVLGLTGTILGLSVWALMHSMSLVDEQISTLLRYIAITVLGLLGTGVSLC